jgi:uncharacterized Zn-finger protein
MANTVADHSNPDALQPPEVFVIEGHRVSCDGGGGALGHPRVWLEMGQLGFAECGYCDRRFIQRGGPADR